MRLICPNCGAQYEVDDGMIPADGRDVQCSNCGHTWFENPQAPSAAAEEDSPAPAKHAMPPAMPAPAPKAAPEVEPEADPAPEVAAEPEPEAAPESTPDVAAEPEPEDTAEAAPEAKPDVEVKAETETAAVPEAEAKPEAEPGAEPEAKPDHDEAPEPEPQTAAPPRPALDSSIAEILREEAAREEAARRAETDDGLQSQGDLGLTDPAPAAGTAIAPPPPAARTTADAGQQRLDRLRGSPAGAIATTGARSEMFPDIEEINSSLRSSAERGPMAMLPAEEEASNRRSGRRGFFGMLMLIIILMAIYVFADQIAQAVPALADVLSSYVAAIDQGRIWLDEKVQSLLPATDNT